MAQPRQLTLAKFVFCRLAGKSTAEVAFGSNLMDLSSANPILGYKRLSLAAEFSMATIAACRRGCQKQDLDDDRCGRDHFHGFKQEIVLHDVWGLLGEPFRLEIDVEVPVAMSWDVVASSESSECTSLPSRHMFHEEISSHALVISWFIDGSTITAAFTNCLVQK